MQTICEVPPKRNCPPTISDCDSKGIARANIDCLRVNQIRRRDHSEMLDIPHNQLKELKAKLQKEAVCYLENERKMLLSQQRDKLRQKMFLQKAMEEYNSVEGKHHRLLRQHQHVFETLIRVKQKATTDEMSRITTFKQKENRLMDRLNEFFKSRMTLSKTKKEHRHKTTSQFISNNQQLKKTSTQFNHCSNSKINRSISSRYFSPSIRTERVLSLRKEQEQKRLHNYIKKLQKTEEKVISLEVSKQQSLRQSKSKPIKILTSVRDNQVEKHRQKIELSLIKKLDMHQQKLNQQRKLQESFIEDKKLQKYKHYEQVSMRHSRFKQTDMKRILDDVQNLNNRSRDVELRKQRQQKIVTMKKQFQIKKHKELEIHNSQLAKLQAKLHNVTLLESSELLNQHVMSSSVRLVKCLTSSDILADLFTKKKQELLNQLNMPKKVNQKQFNIKIR